MGNYFGKILFGNNSKRNSYVTLHVRYTKNSSKFYSKLFDRIFFKSITKNFENTFKDL